MDEWKVESMKRVKRAEMDVGRAEEKERKVVGRKNQDREETNRLDRTDDRRDKERE